MPQAVEELVGREHPAARHDAALLALVVLHHFDPEAEKVEAWGRAFALWREVVERRDFWSLLIASDLKGDFEQLVTHSEVRDLRRRTMRLVTRPVAELGKDSVTRNRNAPCRRALEVIRCGALPEKLVYGYEQEILGPAEDSFEKLREEVFAPYISVFIDETKGPQIWKRFEEEIKPRLRLFLEVAGPRSLATRRVFDSVASSLANLADTYWRMRKVTWIYRKAWAMAPPGSATLLQIEKTLREVGAESYIQPRTEEEYFQSLERELRPAPPPPDIFKHYIETERLRKKEGSWLSALLKFLGLLSLCIVVSKCPSSRSRVTPPYLTNFNASDRYRPNLNYNFDLSKMMPIAATKDVPRLNWRELRRRMKNGGVLIVDARSSQEYEAGHIPGALSLPEESVREKNHLLVLNRRIVTYGADEEAGARVAWQLGIYGHKHVSTLKGGFKAWVKNGQTVELAAESDKVPQTVPPPVVIESMPLPPPKSTYRR